MDFKINNAAKYILEAREAGKTANLNFNKKMTINLRETEFSHFSQNFMSLYYLSRST